MLVVCGLIVLFGACDVVWEAIKRQHRNDCRLRRYDRGSINQQSVRILFIEAELELCFLLKLCLSRCFFLFLNQEFFESECVDGLHVLLKDLGHWVSLALEEVHQVHNLLLAKLQVCHLLLVSTEYVFQLLIGIDEEVLVSQELVVLLL